MTLVSAAVLGAFTLVILYCLFLILYLGPAYGVSNSEIRKIRQKIREITLRQYDKSLIKAEAIDYFVSLEKVRRPIRDISLENIDVISKAVAGESLQGISKKVEDLRKRGISKVSEEIDDAFESNESYKKIYNLVRRRIFQYRVKHHFLGTWLFLTETLPRMLDRWGRYITITAVISVISGYSFWYLSGGSGEESKLIDTAVNFLSYGALISVTIAIVCEVEIATRSVYLDYKNGNIGKRYYMGLIAVLVIIFIFFLAASLLFRLNFISIYFAVAGSLNNFNHDSVALLAAFAVGLYFLLRFTSRMLRRSAYPLSWKLFWSSVSLMSSLMYFSLVFDIDKLNSLFLIIYLSMYFLFFFILFCSWLIKNIEVFIDLRKSKFRVGIGGWIAFIVSLIVFLVGVILIFLAYSQGSAVQGDGMVDVMEGAWPRLQELLKFLVTALSGIALITFSVLILAVFQYGTIERHNKYKKELLFKESVFSSNFYNDKRLLKELFKP